MRILLFTHTFNSLTQRVYVELCALGHDVSIEFDIHESVLVEAVELFKPDLIVAPYLRRAIPSSVWQRHLCIVIHPGIPGDRGPSAVDWAILRGERDWGVTALQANGDMDAGDVWAHRSFVMRKATKGSIYRNEVTEAAVACLVEVLDKISSGSFVPSPAGTLGLARLGTEQLLMKQIDRRVNWSCDSVEVVLRKIRSGDGFPGVLDELCGKQVYLYDAHAEKQLRGVAGDLIARRGGAVCRATVDGAVWIGYLQEKSSGMTDAHGNALRGLKRSAVAILGDHALRLPESRVPLWRDPVLFQEVFYEECDGVGYLHFPFYNGAMGLSQCDALLEAWSFAVARPVRVLALMGGEDFWSNGIHLSEIEAAGSAADQSWENIRAINRVARAIITTTNKVTVSAIRGNAGSGGCFLALASDYVYTRHGVVLNPHYKNMGNLYGSEFWTYVLPRRVGKETGLALMQRRLPLGVEDAHRMGLIDGFFGRTVSEFDGELKLRLAALAASSEIPALLAQKREARVCDEAQKSLDDYEREELKRMRQNFYGFDPSYHVARYNFIFKVAQSRTPLHLAKHRVGR